jgi:hypothetical protein
MATPSRKSAVIPKIVVMGLRLLIGEPQSPIGFSDILTVTGLSGRLFCGDMEFFTVIKPELTLILWFTRGFFQRFPTRCRPSSLKVMGPLQVGVAMGLTAMRVIEMNSTY